MDAVCTIFKREFLGYFRTPVAYVFLIAFTLASIGLPWYVGEFFESNHASMDIFFMYLPWIYLLLIPAAGMRLWAEEKRQGTWEVLLTMPLARMQCVMGKFLAGWAFVLCGLAMSISMPITIEFLGSPDWGVIISGYIGAALMAGAFMGIACFTSALSSNQVISMVISFITCLILLLLGWDVFSDLLLSINLPVPVVDAIANFSFLTHFNPMIQGLITFGDVIFFVSLMLFSLILNSIILDN